MSSVTDWLNGSLKSIDHELFKDVIKVSADVKPMSDGQVVLISDINRTTLTLQTSSGEERTVKAVAKFEPPPGPGRDIANNFDAFRTETLMYSVVLKQMEKLMSEVGDNNYPWPEIYHCADNKLLLQDLCEAGYKIVPTHQLLDLNHTLLVMKTIGKFHGLSMIMESRGILDKTQFKTCYLAAAPPFIVNIYNLNVENLSRNIKKSWGPEWSSVPERLTKYMENIKQKFLNLATANKGKWAVLNHGDFSMRNMLFHYKPNSNIPDDVKFVDFQICHHNNLGFDLTNLLYSSMLPQSRDANWETLLGTYVKSMSATCSQYNYGGPLPTAADVTSSIRSFSFFSTCSSLCALPFFLIAGTEDLQKQTDNAVEMYSNSVVTNSTEKDEMFLHLYQNEKVVEILKYEIKRCIKENIF